jgi:hypothetical protein
VIIKPFERTFLPQTKSKVFANWLFLLKYLST